MSYISLNGITKEYKINNKTFKALDNLSLEIDKGEFVIILGPSGCGKSTLLNIIGGMDKYTSGSAVVDGKSLDNLSYRELTLYRRNYVGFVFQSYNLIPNLTALENVMLSSNKVTYDEALNALKMVDVLDKENVFPSNLSGGEAQRVAIARAVVKQPKLLLCDEPTGALDSKNGAMVMDYLKRMSVELGQTIIAVTHNPDYVKYATRVIRLRDGKLDEGDINVTSN